MTVSSTANKRLALGNGVTTAFTYNFRIPSAASLQVTLISSTGTRTVLAPAQYTVSGLDEDDGGTVTYPLSGSPIATGAALLIERVLPIVQQTQLENQSGYYPAVVEASLDNIVMMLQQIANGAQNYPLALTFPTVDVNPTTELPVAIARANKYLAFDGNGNPIMATGSALTGDVSAYTAVATGSSASISIADRLALRVNVFDFMLPAQILDVQTRTGAVDVSFACQTAIDSLPVTGGIVYFPAGVYKLLSSLILPTGVWLMGDSMRGTQLNAPAGNYAILIPAGVRCGVEKMFLNGAGPGYGIYISLVSTQVDLRDIWFESCVVGLQINNSYFISLYSCSFQSCTTSIAAQIGANCVSLRGCQLNNGANAAAIGIDFQAECASWTISGCALEGWQPIMLRALVYGVSITGNFFENVAVVVLDAAIVVGTFSGAAVTPKGISILGNYFNGNINYAILLKSCDGFTSRNNFFQNKLYAHKLQFFDAPRRFPDIGGNAYNINGAGYDYTKAIVLDGPYGDALSCALTPDCYGWILHGIKGVPTASMENGEAVIYQTDGSPGGGLSANTTYLGIKTAGVVTNWRFPLIVRATIAGVDPPSIADGDSWSTPLAFPGVSKGDSPYLPSFEQDLLGLAVSGQINSANQMVVTLVNNTGGAVDVPAGYVKLAALLQ